MPAAGCGATRRAIGLLLSSAVNGGTSARPGNLCESVVAEYDGVTGGVNGFKLRSSDGGAIEIEADRATNLLKAGSQRTIGLARDTALIKRIFYELSDE